VTDVAETVLAGHLDRSLGVERLDQGASELRNRVRLAAGDVERARYRRLGTEREHVRASDVSDVDEVPDLPPVLENGGSFPTLDRATENARNAGVWCVARHPRPVDVVVAKRRDRDA